MTFLELCQGARREAKITYNGAPTPTTTVNQSGVLGTIVECVREGWITLQTIHPNWKFLRGTKVQALTPTQRTYSLVTDLSLQYLRDFDPKGLFIEETSQDKTQLTYEDWEDFRARIISTNPGRPQLMTVNPDGEVEFDVTPDKAYIVRLSHWLTAETLDDDTDVPSIAHDLHEIVVWEAVMRYAGRDTAGELYQHASAQRNRFLAQMQVRYLPLPVSAGPCPPAGLAGR